MKDHLNHMVDHIAKLAMNPAWIEEMRRFTKELESDESGFYKGLGLAVKKQIELFEQQKRNGGSNDTN